MISDPYEGTQAVIPSGQEAIAGGLAQAIEQYFAPTAPRGQNSESAKPAPQAKGSKPVG